MTGLEIKALIEVRSIINSLDNLTFEIEQLAKEMGLPTDKEASFRGKLHNMCGPETKKKYAAIEWIDEITGKKDI